MQCTVKQYLLNRGLTMVGHAVPTRAILPIQKYILATAEGGRVRLSARREDLGIQYWIDADTVDDEGVALLPAHLLTDFVRNVPAAPITLTSPSPLHADSCHVRCLRSRADMKNATDDPAEFSQPPLFRDGGERLMQLDAELLKQVIAQTAFAAAEKEGSTWPWAVGLQMEIAEGQALFAATDSFRLALSTLPVPDDQLRCRLLVPAKAMRELARMLPDEGTVHLLLTPDRTMLLFHIELAHQRESMDLSTRLLSGENYPNLRQAVPTVWTTRAVMHTQELAATVKLMLPYAHENGEKIHVHCFGEHTEGEEAKTISLATFATDVGEIENSVSAEVQGPTQGISLHANYLLEMLEALDAPKVALEVTERNRPAVLRPIGPGEFAYVMMPIQEEYVRPQQASAQERRGVVTTNR